MSKDSVEYERIYFNQSRAPGRMRIADSGLGWKGQTIPGSSAKNDPVLLAVNEVSSFHWSRGSRGWELRIDTKDRGVMILDGFDQQDFNGLKAELMRNFKIELVPREHSLRGWNWGKTQLARNELVFNVNNKPAFEIPYKEISNSNMSNKNEVSVELDLIERHKDLERAGDELVEIKLYLPGTVEDEADEETKSKAKKETEEGSNEAADEEDDEKDETETKTLAQVLFEELKEKAEIGEVADEAIVSFGEVLFLTPRGRYDIDMYENHLRLRGKTYDYKVQYQQIQRIFVLPKLDQLHHIMVLQVDPPLRQGQTRYSFLTLQFDSQEEIEVELNLDDDEYEANYKTKLSKKYSSYTYIVMSNIFKGLTDRRVVLPGSFLSRDSLIAVSCSLKASEGQLYPLEKCFLFVTKPTVLIPYSEVANITFSRIGQGSAAPRTFDMEVNLRSGGGSHTFGNIDRAEQPKLEEFLKSKNLKVKNDEKEAQVMLAAAMGDDDDDDEDADMGSVDEDESPDEDFDSGSASESDSDVAEEFDSDAMSVGGDSGDESGDEPASKKAKK